MVKKIMVALDGSPSSERALELAMQLATNTGAGVLFVTVASDDPLTQAETDLALRKFQPEVGALLAAPEFATSRQEGGGAAELANQEAPHRNAELREAMAQHILAEAKATAAHRGLSSVQTLLRSGDPAAAILALATAESPDLLVVGNRGLSARAGRLMGSVSDRLVREACCSAITVKSPELDE